MRRRSTTAPRLCCLLALALLAGCYADEGSGDIALETYPVDGFTEVVLHGAGQATIVPGEYRVAASADSDVLPTVRVERRGRGAAPRPQGRLDSRRAAHRASGLSRLDADVERSEDIRQRRAEGARRGQRRAAAACHFRRRQH